MKSKMKLSVVIPAHNEEGCIEGTVVALTSELQREKIDYEVLVINDNSKDGTEDILRRLAKDDSGVRYINNRPPNGFGFAVRAGLENFSGDAVAVYMADASDDPKDLVKFWRKLEKGYDCVFGTRWQRGGKTIDYPWPKRVLNRLANTFIQIVMQLRYDDITNAFKLYRREVIEGLQPVISHHFNLTVELPLKAIVRGYSYAVVPNSWTNRKAGESKLKIKEMGSRYLFIVLYCLIEKWLSRKDYHRSKRGAPVHVKKLEPAGAEA
jgi:dolichol-phosphate mannosyltransferase